MSVSRERAHRVPSASSADCPACQRPLDVTDDKPPGTFATTRRYATGRPRDRVLYGACSSCDLLVVDVALMLESDQAERDDVLEAIAGARRAREIFDSGYGNSRAAMTELARAFHSLRSSEPPGVSPWDPVALLGWVESSGASVHEIYCAHFVLSVWNLGDTEDAIGSFNAMRALAGWDRAHRAVYVEWARQPWWP